MIVLIAQHAKQGKEEDVAAPCARCQPIATLTRNRGA